MERWTGIINGTNKGSVILDLVKIENNKVSGFISVFDYYQVAYNCKLDGNIEDGVIIGRIYDFNPQVEGMPKEGTFRFQFLEDGKEIKGTWQTDLNTNGDLTLYKLPATANNDSNSPFPELTLETKDITILFSTFTDIYIKDIFQIMRNIVNGIREKNQHKPSPPIFSIVYDAEERIRTYNIQDFYDKLSSSKKVLYIGFEFEEQSNLTNIKININHQESFNGTRSNIFIESIDKEIVVCISEMLRGLVSKTRNKHDFFYRKVFDVIFQLLGVCVILALSFYLSKRISTNNSDHNIYIYTLIATLIILSNLWTYLSNILLTTFRQRFPVVEIINKQKDKVWTSLTIGIASSVFAAALIYLVTLFFKYLFTK